MASSYLNTGVLGQVTGGSLSISGLKSTFDSFKTNVLGNKLSISGVSAAEREAQRKRREKRLQQSVVDTATETRPGISVDTADITPPSIPVDETAPPAVQQKQQALNITAATNSVVKSPVVQAAPVSPAESVLAPEKQFTDADRAFATAYDSFTRSINSKNDSDVNRGASSLQSKLTNVLTMAEATGRSEVLTAVQSISGILGQNHISAKNVGQAKASTLKASSDIRSVLDIDTLMRESLMTGTTSTTSTTTAPTLTKTASRFRSLFAIR